MARHAQQDPDEKESSERQRTDDPVRGRLRGLFSTSQKREPVEDLIAARGRELEERSAQLRTTVAELEQREAQASELQARVEQILRDGAAELDLRQAELTTRASELDRREAALTETEATVEERRRELGAVELRRAAVERREEAVRLREEDVECRAGELDARERRLDDVSVVGETPSPRPTRDDEFVALLAGERYRLVAIQRPAPLPGEIVEIDGEPHRCVRVTTSPLPADDRRCALMEPVSAPGE